MKYKCGLIEKSCCQASGLPWLKHLRVCGDSSTNADSTPVGLYDIYIEMNNWNMFQKCFSYLFVAQWNTFGDSIYSNNIHYCITLH